MAIIKPPRWWLYKLGDFLAVGTMNYDYKIDLDDDDKNWDHSELWSGHRSHPGNINPIAQPTDEEDTNGGENRTIHEHTKRNGKLQTKVTKDRNRKGKAMDGGMWNRKGNKNVRDIVQ
jgi:hypothetical protein